MFACGGRESPCDGVRHLRGAVERLEGLGHAMPAPVPAVTRDSHPAGTQVGT